jgi:hypothetical protein
MKIFRLLTAIRIIITAGTTAANCPGIPVATNASEPIAISVEKHHQQVGPSSPTVSESELPFPRVFTAALADAQSKCRRNSFRYE